MSFVYTLLHQKYRKCYFFSNGVNRYGFAGVPLCGGERSPLGVTFYILSIAIVSTNVGILEFIWIRVFTRFSYLLTNLISISNLPWWWTGHHSRSSSGSLEADRTNGFRVLSACAW